MSKDSNSKAGASGNNNDPGNLTDDENYAETNSDVGSLGALTKERQYIRQRITYIHTKIETDADNLTIKVARGYITNLEKYGPIIQKQNIDIFSLCLLEGKDQSVLNEMTEKEQEYESKLYNSLCILRSLVGSNIGSSDQVDSNLNTCNNVTQNKLKLPEVKLPTFGNDPEESLEKFLYEFESILSKHNLSCHEKFVYLKNQLYNSPKILINSLDIAEQRYTTAKDLLIKAFASTIVQRYSAIRKLSKMNLSYNDDPYSYVGEIKTIINTFNHLKIDVETIIQYFVWSGCNDKFQNHLVQIINKNTPSLGEITDNMFHAIDRYNRDSKKFNENKARIARQKSDYSSKNKQWGESTEETHNYALNVKGLKNGFKFCILCESDRNSDPNHFLRYCQVYNNSKKKIDKLISLNACTKCGFKNHQTSNCKFVFKTTCRHCNGNHFSCLCNNLNREQNRSNRVVTNVSSVEILNCNIDDAVVLPTLSLRILSNVKSDLIRVFKDGGCQRNFILSKLANDYKLKIVKNNVNLNIEGFNSSRSLVTKIVKVPLILNGEVREIDAICVPAIKTELHVKGLNGVVTSFLNKGYVLADELLINPDTVDFVGNISLILGTDSDHLFELHYKTFGRNDPKSSFIQSPFGVLLSGNVMRMINNIDYLPVRGKNLTAPQTDESYNSFFTVSNLPKFNDCDIFDSFGESCLNVYNNQCITVVDDSGVLVESELKKATDEAMREQSLNYLNYDSKVEQMETDTNIKLVNYILDNTFQSPTGHLTVPLPWNYKIVHLLGKNFNLSRQILRSNMNKLRTSPERLLMYDNVFREQVDLGIIERIDNIEHYMNIHPEINFLPHMPIFKLDRDTSKCRVVFLSNLCEKSSHNSNAVSHNQAMLPGPCLNHKIATSLIMLRFNKFLFTFDIKKAFLNIALKEIDQNRLAFLWYKNISKGDFTVVGYKNLKLSFGLRSSPCILMLSLFRILMMYTENDDERIRKLKLSIWSMIYMDNGGYSTNDENELKWAYETIPKIFEPYKFYLQQFCSNSLSLQEQIDQDFSSDTADDIKLLGMRWERSCDRLMPAKINLNCEANTKRSVLKTVNSVYDIFNIYGPILNRAKLYLQRLLNDESLKWDSILSDSLQREWGNITRQVNKTPQISIERFVGANDSSFSLIAFTDASQYIYGVTVYIKDLNTNKVSYLASKSKLVNKDMKRKTIPVLEFCGICLGAELLQELYSDLSGESVALPLNISSMELFTDSMVSLHWIRGYVVDYAKMQKKSVFVMNRLKILNTLCENFPISFNYINGSSNPADFLSRQTSYNQLINTNYYTGPEFLSRDYNNVIDSEMSVTIPNPLAEFGDEIPSGFSASCQTTRVRASTEATTLRHVVSPERYSSFKKLVGVLSVVMKFVHKVRTLSEGRKSGTVNDEDLNFRNVAFRQIIITEQRIFYPDIIQYFDRSCVDNNNTPNLINQLNLIVEDGVVKVKSKFPRSERGYPLLLSKNSLITLLIIRGAHEQMSHAGIYSVLRELRPYYWIPHCYSKVRKILKDCITCRKLNEKLVSINQNNYKDWRVNPPEIPFSYVFLDHAGPWRVTVGKEKIKVWLLVITCLWSRAVNIKICTKLDVPEFLRGVQLHIYEHGLFKLCISDSGSQIRAGTNIIANFIDDIETKNFLQTHGIEAVEFQNYPKGNSSLGSLVESCIKQVKRLLFKSIGKTVLNYFDFDFFVLKVIHLINRRPIAFKDSLRSLPDGEVPSAITPECLVKGRELVSINVIPQLQIVDVEDPDWTNEEVPETIRQNYSKLKKVRETLMHVYHSEFLATLTSQAVDKKDRYKRVLHKEIGRGDLVLLHDRFLKQSSYPMGIVTEVITNSLGEVTSATIKKGNTGEYVNRHSSSLIVLMKSEEPDEIMMTGDGKPEQSEISNPGVIKKRRQCAIRCQRKNEQLAEDNAI